MKKMLSVMLALLCLALSACGGETDALSPLAAELGLDLSAGTAVTENDTHGGFHGDGTRYTVLEFSDDGLLAQIRANTAWKPLPLDETLTTLLYGVTETTDGVSRSAGPYVTSEGSAPLFPLVQNGYVFFLDRHPQKDLPVLSRASFNFTVAIYDTDTHTLHCCRFDT